MEETVVVLIAGGHSSGKRTCARLIEDDLSQRFRTELQITSIDMELYDTSKADFRHPNKELLTPSRYDFDKLKRDIRRYTAGGIEVIVVYGYYALYDRELREMGTLKLFIDSDPDVRLTRWIQRDIQQRIARRPQLKSKEGEALGDLIKYYLSYARPEMNEFIFPTKQYSDVILPRGPEQSGVSLIGDGLVPLIRSEDTTESNSTKSPVFSRSNTFASMTGISNYGMRFFDAS